MESGQKPPPMTARGREGDGPAASIGRQEAPAVHPGVTENARILVVEDQEDVRRMLATALEMEGHVVDEAATAADGLKCLEQSRYDLVLSDYAMPGGTGAWMLHQANQQGLMGYTIAVIVTAHPDVRDLENVEVITKPIDLDRFLEQVRHILETRVHDPPEASPNPSRTSLRSHRHRVELALAMKRRRHP
jgi:DNA-binding NtrC family response regulator